MWQLLLCSTVMQNIQIFYIGPVMFVVICFSINWKTFQKQVFPIHQFGKDLMMWHCCWIDCKNLGKITTMENSFFLANISHGRVICIIDLPFSVVSSRTKIYDIFADILYIYMLGIRVKDTKVTWNLPVWTSGLWTFPMSKCM